LYNRVSSNVRKSWVLILVFTAFVALIGWLFGQYLRIGLWGLGGALLFSIAMTWGSYFSSDKIALSMSRAKPADAVTHANLHNIVEGLALAGGLPKPRIYVVEDSAPNAFATGRNPEHAAIAVTTGLMEVMNRDELEGVLAHELAHVKNRDTLVMTLAVTLVGVIILLADLLIRAMFWGGMGGRDNDNNGGGGLAAPLAILGLVLMILAPIIAQLLQFAISRQREFLADAEAVMLTRYPDGMINALKKLQSDQTVVRSASKATAHLWIESPIAQHANEQRRGSSKGAWLNRMFNTHPPLEARIAALQESSVTSGGEWRDISPPPPPGT